MFDAKLLDLPWVTLVTLVTGYIGYFVANVGQKEHHQPVEITFSTLIFGLFSAMVYHAFTWAGFDTWTATFPTVLYAFASGVYWRRYARKWMYKFLRDNDISWSDNTSSAWQKMFDQRGYFVSEVYVHLKNGTTLLSEHPGNFEGAPGGSLVLGAEKDLLLYATHIKRTPSGDWESLEVKHDDWGVMATYIPADQIARVEIRRTPKNRLAARPLGN
ncbi:hypothetical protein NLN82_23305 [Citrobacter portucalensis]|uniref:hypothetical protein n=1 Tax=Citrobacter portucalensis TaxID=1639133 RepID=UPI00226B0C54|nr:hypothetical protein [Citrobacter portucalensis]MCX9038956.1 hypothetical protein [Citrobacter portucalensis]